MIAGLDAARVRRATRCYGVGRLGEAAQQADCRCTSRVNRRRRNPVWARAQDARAAAAVGLFRSSEIVHGRNETNQHATPRRVRER